MLIAAAAASAEAEPKKVIPNDIARERFLHTGPFVRLKCTLEMKFPPSALLCHIVGRFFERRTENGRCRDEYKIMYSSSGGSGIRTYAKRDPILNGHPRFPWGIFPHCWCFLGD